MTITTVNQMEKLNFHGIAIDLNEIAIFHKYHMSLREICCQILYDKIIEQAAEVRNIVITPEEIDLQAEEVRRLKRLEQASDTMAWLKEEMLSPDEWEIAIRKDLLSRKLARELFTHEAEIYFNQNRPNFDKFLLYQLVVPYEKLAQELLYRIEEEEISFYQAVHLYDIDEQRRNICGYEGEVHRRDYPAAMAAAIFRNPIPVGELTGPIRSEAGYHLFQIESYQPAEFTPEIRQEIIDRLFQQWLTNELNYTIHNNGT